MKLQILSAAMLFGAAVAVPQLQPAAACDGKAKDVQADGVNTFKTIGDLAGRAGDAPADPSVPGMGGSGGGVPGKSELNTGAADPANDDTDKDRDGKIDSYERAMEGRSHDHGSEAGDAPAMKPDPVR